MQCIPQQKVEPYQPRDEGRKNLWSLGILGQIIYFSGPSLPHWELEVLVQVPIFSRLRSMLICSYWYHILLWHQIVFVLHWAAGTIDVCLSPVHRFAYSLRMNQSRAKNGSLNSCRTYSLLQGNFSPEDREAYLKTAIWCLHGCGVLEKGGCSRRSGRGLLRYLNQSKSLGGLNDDFSRGHNFLLFFRSHELGNFFFLWRKKKWKCSIEYNSNTHLRINYCF